MTLIAVRGSEGKPGLARREASFVNGEAVVRKVDPRKIQSFKGANLEGPAGPNFVYSSF